MVSLNINFAIKESDTTRFMWAIVRMSYIHNIFHENIKYTFEVKTHIHR